MNSAGYLRGLPAARSDKAPSPPAEWVSSVKGAEGRNPSPIVTAERLDELQAILERAIARLRRRRLES